jgi:hypothetical protein
MLSRPLNNQLNFIDRFSYSSENWVWPILAETARRAAPMPQLAASIIKGNQPD